MLIDSLPLSRRYEELQTEFEEYQFSSRELENELETQLSLNERRIRELEAKNLHLTNENEILKNKLEKTSLESENQVSLLREQLAEVTSLNDELTTHIRELEQSNDDLERAKRHLDVTLSDFDAKLNEQIERNELLESEIGEKEELQFVIQRLKDEAKDLRLELMIQQNLKQKKSSVLSSDGTEATGSSPSVDGKQQKVASQHKSSPVSAGAVEKSTSCMNHHHLPNSAHNTLKQTSSHIPLLSASSRISALNIVSDLLRKVGALESKLASCRNIMPVSHSLLKASPVAKNNNNSSTSAENANS